MHNGNDIPPGALITFVQKGLQYVEMEAQVTDSAATDATFASLSAHDLLTKSLAELKLLVADARTAATERGAEALRQHRDHRDTAEPMDQDMLNARVVPAGEHDVAPADVTVLRGHDGEVFCANWNPTALGTLASGYVCFAMCAYSYIGARQGVGRHRSHLERGSGRRATGAGAWQGQGWQGRGHHHRAVEQGGHAIAHRHDQWRCPRVFCQRYAKHVDIRKRPC